MNAVYVSINENIRTKDQPALSDSLISSFIFNYQKSKMGQHTRFWYLQRVYGCQIKRKTGKT